jgi:putative ABC transport system ATP-binding protein
MGNGHNLALHLQGLVHAWPGQAPLINIQELSLPLGQHLFIQGPSGCGKSTLLSLLAGVQQVQQGLCEVLGHDLTLMDSVQRDRLRGEQMGVIFQQFNLLPFIDALANALLPTKLFNSRAADASQAFGSPIQQAQSLALSLGLSSSLWQQPVHLLSVGQQQRVAAVRALMGQPQLIIADEPTSALDDVNQLEFLDLLLQTAAKQGASVVMVSHNARLADRFHQVYVWPTQEAA